MFSPEAMTLLKTRYLREGETPDEMFWRVAKHVAQAEELYNADKKLAAEEYYKLMADFTFLPNSPTLMNSGKKEAQLAACFVLPIEDSLAGIFETLKNTAVIHNSGGGTGFSFSHLRPKGDIVSNNGGTANGPLAFIRIFDKAAEVVKQGAVRSGANMAVLRVDHPDILEFIDAKRDHNVLNNFNLSVAITDKFMAAVDQDNEFELINPRTGKCSDTVSAKSIFNAIVDMAWENGEPGLFFLDTVNRANPTPQLGQIDSPNPCSEQPLLAYESCTLGSINLTKMVRNVNGQNEFDFEKLTATVHTAVRFLDSVLDVNCYPLDIVRRISRKTRKIGLGIMGLADMFIMLDIPYGSDIAIETTRRITQYITKEARWMSSRLAIDRGDFPAFRGSILRHSYSSMRNATVSTIAPTGSISMIANCSSGIEPLFALALTRRVLDGHLLQSINKVVLQYLEKRRLLTTDVEALIIQEGSVKDANLPEHIKQVLSTAHEIQPKWHVEQLAAAQQYTDNGVSKTVNLPQCASKDDVAAVFWKAYLSKCKGITVYRDMSRQYQVLVQGTTCLDCNI